MTSRDEHKQRYLAARTAAARLLQRCNDGDLTGWDETNFRIGSQAAVQLTEDGAFVEVQLFVPNRVIEAEGHAE